MNVPRVHFVPACLTNPTNPISLNLIGAGGTGSHLLDALARINFVLTSLGKAGIQVNVFDNDKVEIPNLGRSAFNENYVGVNKAVAIVNKVNRGYGTNWKAIPKSYSAKQLGSISQNRKANITISCVDTVSSRMEIAKVLHEISTDKTMSPHHRDRPMYHMDFGNSKNTGQVILSTIGQITQPKSQKFKAIDYLPVVTEEFADLLISSEETDNTPSCSLYDALNKQDLFINPSLASLGGKLVYSLLSQNLIFDSGFFLNLENFQCEAIKV